MNKAIPGLHAKLHKGEMVTGQNMAGENQRQTGKNGLGERRKQILSVTVSMFLAAVALLLVYASKGMFPFGKGSVMLTDLYSQYGPLLYRFYDVVTGHKNLFMDVDILAGANLYGDTINELINPFNYLLFLFGRQRIYLALNILLLAYVAAMAGAATYVLNRLRKKQEWYHCVLGLGYALSGYVAYNYQIIKWMYFPVLFPFFLWALIRMLQGKKGLLYGLLLAYQLMLSIQLGFMTLLFGLFAGGFYGIYCLDREERKDRLTRMGIWTLLALGLSSVSLVPMVAVLLESARTGQTSSYFGVMKIHGLDDLFERIFQVASPVLMGMTLPVLSRLVKEKDLWKEKECFQKFVLVLWGFLWVTVLVQPANLIWHMGSYFGFPVRYGYMVLFVHCVVLSTWKDRQNALQSSHGLEIKGQNVAAWLLTLVAIVIVIKKEEVLTQGFSSLAISMMCPRETLYVLIVMVALAGATVLGQKRNADVLTVIWGMLVFLMILLPPQAVIRGMNEYAYENMQYNPDTVRHDFMRVKEKNNEPLNAGLVTDIPTLSGYIPAGNGSYLFTMRDLGYRLMRVDLSSQGGTPEADRVLTNAYLLQADAPLSGELQTDLQTIYEKGQKVSGILLDARKGRVQIDLTNRETRPGKAEETVQKGDILFLPLAAVKGWRLESVEKLPAKNGAETYGPGLIRACDGFLGVLLDQGTTQVTLTYRAPGVLLGLVITLAFGVLALGYCLLGERSKWNLYGLYRILFAGGIIGCYIIPAVGLILYMTGKILGIIPR